MVETKPRIIAIVQARMASSRLPGKVLLDLAGEPMLARVVERARRAKTVDEVVVATTADPEDDAVAQFCERRGYPCYRGSQFDVLDRYYQAAKQAGADVVVRITADCLLMDPSLIDKTVLALFRLQPGNTLAAGAQPAFDFAANRLPPPWGRTYPIGLDVEVCTFAALERAWKEAEQPYQREHVMPYLYEEEGRFRVALVNHEKDYGSLRWTVDTPEDLHLLHEIYSRLPDSESFTWLDVLEVWQQEPELAEINASVQHKKMSDVDERRA